jgi:hypothetical protein
MLASTSRRTLPAEIICIHSESDSDEVTIVNHTRGIAGPAMPLDSLSSVRKGKRKEPARDKTVSPSKYSVKIPRSASPSKTVISLLDDDLEEQPSSSSRVHAVDIDSATNLQVPEEAVIQDITNIQDPDPNFDPDLALAQRLVEEDEREYQRLLAEGNIPLSSHVDTDADLALATSLAAEEQEEFDKLLAEVNSKNVGLSS